MKLISLNIWGGKARDALFSFIEEHRDSDVWCFQEVWTSPRNDIEESRGTRVHILDELKQQLPNFAAHFFPVITGLDLDASAGFELTEGKATFVRNGMQVLSAGDAFVYGQGTTAPQGWEDNVPSSAVYVRVLYHGAELAIFNFHGIPFPGDKLDTPARLEQSRRLLECIQREKGEVVLMGDFNLLPDTESIRMFEKAGFRNLIAEYGIATTRSRVSPYYGTPDQQFFADFTFVSPGVSVTDFSVPEECVASDHLPMVLEID